MYGADKERLVERGPGWSKFREYLIKTNPGLNIDVILQKTEVRKDPVISYGILEFVISADKSKVYFHVYRRRHTIEYGILLQGYGQKNQLFNLISLLSEDERIRILNNDWEELWNDYWIDHSSSGYTNLRSQSLRRFNEIKDIVKIINDETDRKRIIDRPLIFPKGKPDRNETGLEAALREAREETKVDFNMDDRSTGQLYFNDPIIQHYSGSDDRPYSDYYYVWKRNSIYSCPTIQLATIQHVRTSQSEPKEDAPYSIVSGVAEDHGTNFIVRKETPRLRGRTISHELESDSWIEIPLFLSNKERLEWVASIDPFQALGIYKRHFKAIVEVHGHLCLNNSAR